MAAAASERILPAAEARRRPWLFALFWGAPMLLWQAAFFLAPLLFLQPFVPAPLQGLSDKPVLRLNCVVLALSPSGLIARFVEFKSERACDLVGMLGGPLRGVNCCFDRARSKNT